MKMKLLIIALLLLGLELRSQRPTSFLDLKFETPNLKYTPLIDWENYQFTARDVPIDSTHFLRVGVPIERSQVVYVHYMDTTNRTYIHRFFLPKGDTLKGQEVHGKFEFEGKNKAAIINRFLYQQGVFGGGFVDEAAVDAKSLYRHLYQINARFGRRKLGTLQGDTRHLRHGPKCVCKSGVRSAVL